MKWIINIAVVLVVAWIVFYHNRSDGEATSTTDTIYIHDTMVVRGPVVVGSKPIGVRSYRVKLLGRIGIMLFLQKLGTYIPSKGQ